MSITVERRSPLVGIAPRSAARTGGPGSAEPEVREEERRVLARLAALSAGPLVPDGPGHATTGERLRALALHDPGLGLSAHRRRR